MNRHLLPIITYRAAAWPYQSTLAAQLDRFQNRLLAMLLHVQFEVRETPAQFFRRRAHRAATICQCNGRWSLAWARQMLNYNGHVQRNHTGNQWPALIGELRGTAWLRSRRAKYASKFSIRQGAWGLDAGITNTRAAPGGPNIRWPDAVINAYGAIDDDERNRAMNVLLKKVKTYSKTVVLPELEEPDRFEIDMLNRTKNEP